MGKLSYKNFELNKTFDLGTFVVTEQEIIDFATIYDPLDFHIDIEAAKNSMFRGLVASGPHLFHLFYKNRWVPLFKNTVMAGMEVNWKLLKPIYANRNVFGKVTIIDLKPNADKNHASVKWQFEFTNDKNETLQFIDITILHNMLK